MWFSTCPHTGSLESFQSGSLAPLPETEVELWGEWPRALRCRSSRTACVSSQAEMQSVVSGPTLHTRTRSPRASEACHALSEQSPSGAPGSGLQTDPQAGANGCCHLAALQPRASCSSPMGLPFPCENGVLVTMPTSRAIQDGVSQCRGCRRLRKRSRAVLLEVWMLRTRCHGPDCTPGWDGELLTCGLSTERTRNLTHQWACNCRYR